MLEPSYYTPDSVQELLIFLISEGKVWGKNKNNPDHIIEMNLGDEIVSNLEIFIQYNNMSESPNGTKHFGIDKNLYLIKSLDEDDFRTLNLKLIKEENVKGFTIVDSNNHHIGFYYPDNKVNVELLCNSLFIIKNIHELRIILNTLNIM
jgi:hypothetical protein